MIKSMTGYGSTSSTSQNGEVTIEIKSVNNRFRDIIVRLPSKLTLLEGKIKKEIEAVISRGRVDASISFDVGSDVDRPFEANLSLARGYLSAIDELKREFALEGEITVSNISSIKDVIRTKGFATDESLLWDTVLTPLQNSLASLDKMRLTEGLALVCDIKERLSNILDIAESVSDRQPEILRSYSKKLQLRIERLTEGVGLDQSRLEQEVALIADRSDITEEVVRLKSHINQFNTFLESEEPVGRKIDFLIQEMNREVNTIGSKSSDAASSTMVVEIKAEIERIREQVQNIE